MSINGKFQQVHPVHICVHNLLRLHIQVAAAKPPATVVKATGKCDTTHAKKSLATVYPSKQDVAASNIMNQITGLSLGKLCGAVVAKLMYLSNDSYYELIIHLLTRYSDTEAQAAENASDQRACQDHGSH